MRRREGGGGERKCEQETETPERDHGRIVAERGGVTRVGSVPERGEVLLWGRIDKVVDEVAWRVKGTSSSGGGRGQRESRHKNQGPQDAEHLCKEE